MPAESDVELREILGLETVAVVGCSTTPGKAAHDVPAYLRDQGYEVVPVNPYAEEIFGRTAYDSLTEVETEIDIANVFRPSQEVSGIVDDALGRDDVRVIWTQLGISDPAATRRAENAGRTVVQDRCIKIEHERLVA
jgi:predicted CoA-binding protein